MLVKLTLAIVVSLLLHVVVKWFAQLRPAEPEVDLSEVPPEMIARAAVKANRIGTGSALLVFLLLWPAWVFTGYALDALLRPAIAADELIVTPLHIGRWFRGAIAAYVLAAVAAQWLMRLFIGKTYYLSMAAGNQHFGFNASLFFYVIIVWVLPFCIEYELHAIGAYTLLKHDELVEGNTLLWPPTHRPWNTLTKLQLDRPYGEDRAEFNRSPECRMTFADDYTWTDLKGLFPYHPDWTIVPWADACEIVSRDSGVPITIVDKIDR
jgi:hypothetical protein